MEKKVKNETIDESLNVDNEPAFVESDIVDEKETTIPDELVNIWEDKVDWFVNQEYSTEDAQIMATLLMNEAHKKDGQEFSNDEYMEASNGTERIDEDMDTLTEDPKMSKLIPKENK